MKIDIVWFKKDFRLEDHAPINAVAKSNNDFLGVFVIEADTKVATCSRDETIKVWSLPEGKELITISPRVSSIHIIPISFY